jgi:hypothetical protein
MTVRKIRSANLGDGVAPKAEYPDLWPVISIKNGLFCGSLLQFRCSFPDCHLLCFPERRYGYSMRFAGSPLGASLRFGPRQADHDLLHSVKRKERKPYCQLRCKLIDSSYLPEFIETRGECTSARCSGLSFFDDGPERGRRRSNHPNVPGQAA